MEKKRTPTVVFGEWAERGRDEGMAKGHQQAVDHMLELVLNNRKSFSFLDAAAVTAGLSGKLPNTHNVCRQLA